MCLCHMENKFDSILKTLELRLNDLFIKLLKPYLAELPKGIIQSTIEYSFSETDETKYQIDVEAYVVLSHAAFEHYFEEIAKETVKQSVEMWNTTKKVNDTLLLLVSYMLSSGGESEEMEQNEELKDNNKPKQNASNKLDLRYIGKNRKLDEIIASNYHIDLLIANAENYFYNKIITNNGIEYKYLMKILIPVALDILEDSKAAIINLKTYRGRAAHKTSIISESSILKDIPSPLDIFQNEKYITKFCKELCEQAKNKF
jgi:hypothetical protein